MSYAGLRADCPHEGGTEFNPNCTACIRGRQEAVGVRDDRGVLHAPNGGGPDAYCVGHVEKDPRWPDGDGRCTVLVRHCPVLNTPEQVAANRLEDAEKARATAAARMHAARRSLEDANRDYDRAAAAVRRLRIEARR